MNVRFFKYIIAGAAFIAMAASCEKNNVSVDTDGPTPPEAARFLRTGTVSFAIPNTPGAALKIPVGITTVSSTERKVQFNFFSRSGAVNGTQYTAPASLTIPAGAVVDSLPITADYAQYDGGKRDTVRIKITAGEGFVKPNAYSDSVTLILRR